MSTLVTRDRGRAERDPGDPLDLRTRVDARVGRAVGRARLLAEVDPAGQLADDEQVGALDHLALERAGVVQRRQRPDRPQVGEQAEPLAQAEQALLGRGLDGSVVSHFGPPTAASSTASAPRQAASVSSVSAVPWASIDAPPNRCSSYSNSAPTAREHLDRRSR